MSDQLAALTGDPDSIAGAAANYQTMSEVILQASSELMDISNNDKFKSLAIVEIRSRASSTSAKVKDVHDRYVGAAGALATYASQLQSAQLKAKGAIAAYASAEEEIHKLTIRIGQVNDQILTGGPEVLALKHQKSALEAQLGDFENELAAAKSTYQAAESDKDTAAKVAINSLQLAADADHLNDTKVEAAQYEYQQFVTTAVSDLNAVLETIASIASQVSDLLSIIGVILMIIPFPPLEALGAIVIGVSKIAALVSLAATLESFLLGGSTLGDLISATITAVASIALGKLGSGIAKLAEKKLATSATDYLFTKVGADASGKGGTAALDELIPTAAGEYSDHYISDPAAKLFETRLSLFPESSGQPWNVPPTVQLNIGSTTSSNGVPTLLSPGGTAYSPQSLVYAAA